MLIRLAVVMTDALLGVTAFFLAPILFPGVVRSKLLLLTPALKPSIRFLPMLLLKLNGYNPCYVNWVCVSPPPLCCGVIILELLT
jgi:hypothetical protein